MSDEVPKKPWNCRPDIDHAPQADRGADFDFLTGRSGSPAARDNH
jgi:hypothetical protein